MRSTRPTFGRCPAVPATVPDPFLKANLGCFGMFECIDDGLVAAGLLNAAAEWLRARGRTLIRGPIDYSTNYPCGLLIDGFDTPPRFMMNHGLPYYDPLLVSCGLAKVKDLYAWWFTDSDDMMAKWKRHADWISRRGNVTVRPFSKRDFAAEVRRCHEVYDGARNDSWGYVDLSDAEFQYMAKRMAHFGVSEHVLLAEVDGKTGRVLRHHARFERGRPATQRTLTPVWIADRSGQVDVSHASRKERPDDGTLRLGRIPPPRYRRTVDPQNLGLRKELPRLYRRRTRLDGRGQLPRQSDHRASGRQTLQDLSDLRKELGLAACRPFRIGSWSAAVRPVLCGLIARFRKRILHSRGKAPCPWRLYSRSRGKIGLMCTNDAEMLKQLLDRHGGPLVLYARQWCDSPEDVLQESLIKLVRLKKPPDHPVGWIYRAVRNGAISAARAGDSAEASRGGRGRNQKAVVRSRRGVNAWMPWPPLMR